MSDYIELSDFRVQCIVGILDRERREPQTLDISLRLHLDLDDAAFGDLSESVDYAAVANQVEFLATRGEWWLLESMASAACALWLAEPAAGEGRAPIEAVDIKLGKPDVLGGQATPYVRVKRKSGWRALAVHMPADGVMAEVLQVADGVGAYRVHWRAGAEWSPPGESHELQICETEDGGRSALVVMRPPLA